jgi:hypothetical protein
MGRNHQPEGDGHDCQASPLPGDLRQEERAPVLEGAEGTRRGRVDYEIVKQPVRKSKRACSSSTQRAAARPGDRVEDGTILREESDELEARVRAGRLREPMA